MPQIQQPDILGNILKGRLIRAFGEERKAQREDRNFLRQQRQQAQQQQAEKDFFTVMSHMDPANVDPDDFMRAGQWYVNQHPEDTEAVSELQRLSNLSPQEMGQYVQQAHNALGIKPRQQKTADFTLSPGQTRYGAEGDIIATAPGAQPKPPMLSQTGKLIAEQKSYPVGSPEWQFYQNKLETEQMEPLSEGEITQMAEEYVKSGKRPFVGRSKWVVKANAAVKRKAIELEQAAGRSGADTFFNRGDTKALQSSIQAQEKSRGAMGSFVRNLSDQVDKVGKLSKDLETYDTRLLNIPINSLKRRIAGDPKLAKYRLYISEITNEIGKIASGSTGSVAELSEGARENWERILDPNLSISAMTELLDEVKSAGEIRMKSVDDTLDYTRKRLRQLGDIKGDAIPTDKPKPLKFNMSTGGFD